MEKKINEEIEKCKCNGKNCTASIKNKKLIKSKREGIFLTCWCTLCNIHITKILNI